MERDAITNLKYENYQTKISELFSKRLNLFQFNEILWLVWEDIEVEDRIMHIVFLGTPQNLLNWM